MITIQKRIWSLFNNGIELIAGIGLVAAITRIYTPDEAGTWFLFIAIFGIASSLRDALVQSALVKHTAGVEAQESFGFLKANLATTFGFEFVSNTLILLAAWIIKGNVAELLLYYPVYSIPNAWFRWQVFYFRSHLQIKTIAMINAINVVILIAGCSVVSIFQLPLSYLVIVLGTGSFLGALAFATKIPYRKIAGAVMERESFDSIRHYGLFAMLREATSSISSRVSLFYSSHLLTLHQTAFLGVSQRFAQITLLPNNAFQSLLFPSLMKSVNEGKQEEAKWIFEHSLAQLLAITIPFALCGALLSPFILEIISGPDYRNAWGILTVYLLLSTLITPFGTAFGSMVTVLGKPGIAFRVVLVNSVLNTALGYLLMRSYGLAGGPMAMAITEFCGFIWIGSILHRLAGIRFLNTFKMIPAIYMGFIQKAVLTFSQQKSSTRYSKLKS